MKLTRNISGSDLAKRLDKFGYSISRQTSSHIRLTTQFNGEHHITIPNHIPIKIGTLSAILSDIANHLQIEKKSVIIQLFNENE